MIIDFQKIGNKNAESIGSPIFENMGLRGFV